MALKGLFLLEKKFSTEANQKGKTIFALKVYVRNYMTKVDLYFQQAKSIRILLTYKKPPQYKTDKLLVELSFLTKLNYFC